MESIGEDDPYVGLAARRLRQAGLYLKDAAEQETDQTRRQRLLMLAADVGQFSADLLFARTMGNPWIKGGRLNEKPAKIRELSERAGVAEPGGDGLRIACEVPGATPAERAANAAMLVFAARGEQALRLVELLRTLEANGFDRRHALRVMRASPLFHVDGPIFPRKDLQIAMLTVSGMRASEGLVRGLLVRAEAPVDEMTGLPEPADGRGYTFAEIAEGTGCTEDDVRRAMRGRTVLLDDAEGRPLVLKVDAPPVVRWLRGGCTAGASKEVEQNERD